MLYLKRPRAKSWELRRCGGALQIQRLEGSRPRGTMGFVFGGADFDRLRVCRCCQSAWVSVGSGRENGHEASHGRGWSARPYHILTNARHRSSVRANARARFDVGVVDSCGAPVEMRRGSKEQLRGGEAFDYLHDSAAKRTLPQRTNGQRG